MPGGAMDPVSGVIPPRPLENRDGAAIGDVFPHKNP
jgi:hypothetical protein